MSQKPETVFQKKVLTFLKNLPRTHAFKIQQVVIRGVPDILACINGYFVALELKAHRDAITSALQMFNLDRINICEGCGLKVSPENWEDTQGMLTALALYEGEKPWN